MLPLYFFFTTRPRYREHMPSLAGPEPTTQTQVAAMQHNIPKFALLALFALSTSACDDDDDPVQPVPETALVRIVNAADIADVEVQIAGTTTPLAQNLDFRGVTQTCVEVPAGNRTLVFSSSGVELGTVAFDFEDDERYTAFLAHSGPTRRAFVLADDEVASANNNALRLVNATTTDADIYVIPPGGAAGAGFLAGGNIGPVATGNSMPAYVHRSTQHTQVQLFDPGVTTGTPRADFALTGLPASRLATVVFTEEGTPAGPTAFMVTPCP